jgi:hypothetical protein
MNQGFMCLLQINRLTWCPFDAAAFYYLLKFIEERKLQEVFHRAKRELDRLEKEELGRVFIKTKKCSFTLE